MRRAESREPCPDDSDDASVRLLNELGGAAGRQPVYAALLTAPYDRQVVMYEAILATGHPLPVGEASTSTPK